MEKLKLLGMERSMSHYNTRLYKIWAGMKQRCKNPKATNYKDYGGRGICYCEEWESFCEFYEWAKNNGYSDKLTLDRIDFNGDYTPNNCRWITIQQQQNNRRNNNVLVYNGESHTLTEWSKITGFNAKTIDHRINRDGWTIEDALTIQPKLGNKMYRGKSRRIQND